MRYIVVYIFLILGVSALKTSAQKPTIDLLPSASASAHPEALIDTCITPDSLFLIDSTSSTPVKKRNTISGSTYTRELSPAFRKRTNKALAFLNPISFIIHFTALKF